MKSSRPRAHARALLCVCVASFTLAGCGDDAGGAGAFGTQREDTYAIVSLTFGDDGSTSYVNLVRTLDAQPTITLASAEEFAGYAPVDTMNGYVFVGAGEAPTLARYEVSDDGLWSTGATVGFNAFSSMSLSASAYVSGTKAYAPFAQANHVIWNPETMTIVGELGVPDEIPATIDALSVWRGYGHVQSGRYLYQPYYYADSTYHAYTAISKVAVIDTQTDTYSAVIDAPCPHLHIATQDDDGNVYLSNGQGSIATAVLDQSAARNCMVRIKRGETTLDTAFTTDFRDLTDGREGSNLFYIGDGIAFFNVYHQERDTITEETEFAAVDYSSSYHLWTLDLATMQASIMDGVDFGGGQFTAFRIDDRTIVAIPAPDYSTTAVYEMTPHGAPVKLFDVEGWAFNFLRVR